MESISLAPCVQTRNRKATGLYANSPRCSWPLGWRGSNWPRIPNQTGSAAWLVAVGESMGVNR